MKKLLLLLCVAIFTFNLWSMPQIDGVKNNISKIISDVKAKINGLSTKDDKEASRVLKYCDQMIANGYSNLTQMSYLVEKYSAQLSPREYKKYKKEITNFNFELKKLKRASQTGYLEGTTTSKDKEKKMTATEEKQVILKKSKVTSEKTDENFLKLQDEIPIATSNPWEMVVLYDENIDRKIHNVYVVLQQAESIVAESDQLPRFSARKEIGQMRAFISDAESFLKKMEYVAEKYSFRLRAMNKTRKVKDKIEKQRVNLREVRRDINNFSNGKPVETTGKKGGNSVLSKIKRVFSHHKGKKRNFVRVERTFSYQEALPAPEEKYNDKLYIENNLDRVKKRFDFIENSLKKLNTLNRASEEALKLSDEISYWFRQSGRALKNIELKLEKNSFIFKHEGLYTKWHKEYDSLMGRMNELMSKFDDYKKGIK
jgi:hypothetical protein